MIGLPTCIFNLTRLNKVDYTLINSAFERDVTDRCTHSRRAIIDSDSLPVINSIRMLVSDRDRPLVAGRSELQYLECGFVGQVSSP